MLLKGPQHFLAALAALAALSTPLVLAADNSKSGDSKAKPAAGAKPAKEQPARKVDLKVKSFTLKKGNPEGVRQTVTQLWPLLRGKHNGQPQQAPLISINSRTNTLFVRAEKEDLETVSELIDVLEGSDKDKGELKNLTIIRLRHAPANEVMQVLQPLGFQSAIVPLPQMNAIVLVRSGDEAEEIEEVISQVDQPASSPKTTRVEGKKPTR